MALVRALKQTLLKKPTIYSNFLKNYCCQKKQKCTLIPGDGVGPELVESLKAVFEAANVPIEFECFNLSETNPDPNVKYEDVIDSISKNKICIQGHIDHPPYEFTTAPQTVSMMLRTDLELFANVVHFDTLPGIETRHGAIDSVIIREQTEGEYSAQERESVPGVVECLKIITAKKSLRIAKFAFDYAVMNKRKMVTAIHKANIMKIGDGLFLSSCEDISKMYPQIKFEKMIVDNATMQLVSNPGQFDVMVTPNLYGNILNNIAAGLVGGAGVVPGVSYSNEIAVFAPGARHTFAVAKGQKIANPTAMLLCGVKLLTHIHLKDHSRTIKNAINQVLSEGSVRTKDLGGCAGTEEFTKAIIENIC